MKALVVGGGSIGRRHLRNLKGLGVEAAVAESDRNRCEGLVAELGVRAFDFLEDGLRDSPDFVVVATPTHLHAEQTLAIVRAGIDVFVEKPLCHDDRLLSELVDWSSRKGVVSLVGCNMRFHPGPAQVKALLEKNCIGRVLFARVHAGSYLPSWRPGTDYRMNYAAKQETGGGCLLDFIHEIDLTRWYMGEVEEAFCMAGHLSSLEISTEDVAAMIWRHSSGALSEIHVDYVQRSYERGCQIVGERGTIFWDFMEKQVRWFDAGSETWTVFQQPESWEINQMYLDEMRHFIDCIGTRKASVLPIAEAAVLMRIVLAAKESARAGRSVAIEREAVS